MRTLRVQEGATIPAIAEVTGRSVSTVHRILAGVKAGKNGSTPGAEKAAPVRASKPRRKAKPDNPADDEVWHHLKAYANEVLVLYNLDALEDKTDDANKSDLQLTDRGRRWIKLLQDFQEA